MPADQPALVHDYLLVLRGAERTFAAMADLWPTARVHTLLYDREATQRRFDDHVVVASALQRLGVRQGGFRRLLPLFPPAVERLPVQGAALVVSSSSAFAHGVRPEPGATHVCYCHSPFRYVWFERERALSEVPRAGRPALDRLLGHMREWDLEASTRVTHYVANSQSTRARIAQVYGRDAAVVHPPVAIERMTPQAEAPDDFVLIVCELVRHKRVDVALRAARRAGRHVHVVGTGPDLERLRRSYRDIATFRGRIDDDELAGLYARALALVVPNAEEFGIAAVEAQAAGRPVVALAEGGATETVVDGVTGVLVADPSVEAFAQALHDTDFHAFAPTAIRANAERFSTAAFRREIRAQVEHARSSTGGR
jgi:glycosyltransferase involved in cell wall biosynthesis